MLNQATLLINTLLLAMACALLSVAVKAAPAEPGAEMQLLDSTVSMSLHRN